MSRELIQAQIEAIIGGVAGIGQVHGRERWAPRWSDFLELFKSADKINGCTVSRRATWRQQVRLGERDIAHVFVIRCYYGLRDADDSEGIFQTLVDAMMAALLATETLNSTCNTTHPDWGPMAGSVGPQLDVLEMRMFGTVLCHYAELRICAEESESV